MTAVIRNNYPSWDGYYIVTAEAYNTVDFVRNPSTGGLKVSTLGVLPPCATILCFHFVKRARYATDLSKAKLIRGKCKCNSVV